MTKTNTEELSQVIETSDVELDLTDNETAFEGGPRAVELCRAEAMELRTELVDPFRSSATLVAYNARRGVAALRGVEDACAVLPGYSKDRFDRVERFARALAWVAHQAMNFTKPGVANALLREAREVRGAFLPWFKAAVSAGLIPPESIRTIVRGKVGFPLAHACMDCAVLFTKYQATLTKISPIRAEDLERASAVGDGLLSILRPRAAHRRRPLDHLALIDLRDRVWTLLLREYEYLLRFAGFIFFSDPRAQVPMLFAAHHVRKKKIAKTETTGEEPKSKADDLKPAPTFVWEESG